MSEEKNDEKKELIFDHWIYPSVKYIFNEHKSINEVIDECIVVLDTNILLLPYTVNKQSLDQITQTYEKLISERRLVIPGQVAREFANNRPKKLGELFHQLSEKKAKSYLSPTDYPIFEQMDRYIEIIDLENKINKLYNEYKTKIGNLLDKIKEWSWDDPVSLIYYRLFKENLIEDIEVKEDEIREEFEKSKKYRIPPGYKDKAKSSGGIGDLIIWNTILHIGKKYNKDVIFVSGEEKADWWHRSNNITLLPRYELVNKFRESTEGKEFFIAEFSRFLELFGANPEVVQEIKKKERSHYAIKAGFTIGKTEYLVNGQSFIMDVAPYIKNSQTYIPVMYGALALGVDPKNILWDELSKKMTILKGNTFIQITVDSTELIVNGVSIKMDVPPEITLNHVMIPFRVIAQALGAVVSWDESSQMIVFMID